MNMFRLLDHFVPFAARACWLTDAGARQD